MLPSSKRDILTWGKWDITTWALQKSKWSLQKRYYRVLFYSMEKGLCPIIDDNLIWHTWLSDFHLPAITVADQIQLFQKLIKEGKTIHKLAKELSITFRATETLCHVIISLGLLEKKSGKIQLTSLARSYLLPDSPSYWGSIYESLREKPEHQQIFSAITSLRKPPLFEELANKKIDKPKVDLDIASNYMSRLNSMIFSPAKEAVKALPFQKICSLLDIGGGSGTFVMAFVDYYLHKKAGIFDLPNVCKVAEKCVQKCKGSSKIQLYSGNFFQDEFPVGYDGILFSQIFHDWPPDYCKKLAEKAYSVLSPGGTILIHEMLLDDDRCGPLPVACMDLLMFVSYQAQQYTKKELTDLLSTVGFKNIEVQPTFGYFSILSATK